MNITFLKDLCEKIRLPQEDRELAFQQMERHPARVERYAKQMYRQNDVVGLEILLRINRRRYAPFVLAALLCAAEYTYAGYRERGIPERYYYDIMQDITRWTENGRVEFGVPGFSEISWAKNYITMNLFQLGRLQFQFSRVELSGRLSREQLKSLPIPDGAEVLYIHIPKGAPLEREACLDSIRQAKAFFPKYYPDFHFQGFYTSSWLLDPRLKQLLPSGSRILQFQELFDRIDTHEDHSRAAIRFLWYRHDRDFAAFPEQTRLQRSVKQYLLGGGTLGETCGMIPLHKELTTE